MQLEFFGAAGEVTGSCHILTVNGRKILLDCGLIQGGRDAEARNADPFPFAAEDIDAVVLSHAHIDHSGRLPLLVKRGFNATIHAHNATRDLCAIMLRDSASLQERDVEYENRKRERKGKPLLEPLYRNGDAEETIRLMRGHRYRQPFDVIPGIRVQFRDAGHIMGSCCVEVWVKQGDVERKLVFSGDLGQFGAPILRDPESADSADVVLMECTYGNRKHRDLDETVLEFGDIIKEAAKGKGNIMIPAFAVGRSQNLLYTLGANADAWGLKRWHVFLDSPMAVEASKVYWQYPHLYDGEATKFRRNVLEMPVIKQLHLTPSREESQVINRIKQGALIIAGSGMCNGGRILHHLKHNLWRKSCHLVIVGYQAEGTLGRRLVDGAKRVRIHREAIQVAAKIHTVGGLSAHGDVDDLSTWYQGIALRPPVFLVHGEPRAAKKFAATLTSAYQTDVTVAQPGMTLDLLAMAAS